MENFDLLFTCMTDMGITQQALKSQIKLNNAKVDLCSKEQQLISQQVKANSQVVAQLTMCQFDDDGKSVSAHSESLISDEEEDSFQNVFNKKKGNKKPEHSRAHREARD